MNSKCLTYLILLLCFSFCGFSQADYCFEVGNSVNLNSLNFPECSGALTYDISGGGINCSECDLNQTFNSAGIITITAYSGGTECGEVSLSIENIPTITLNTSTSPNCNEVTYQGEFNGNVSGWSWDFNQNNQEDSDSQSGFFIAEENGSQDISLTVTSNQGCEITTIENVAVNGPQAELSFLGEQFGNEIPLSVFTFNNLDCVVSYCVNSLIDDNTIIISDSPHPVVGGGSISSYTISFNGNQVYSSGTAPASLVLDMSNQGNPGYNALIYEITDSNGCIFTKEYSVYWESFSINGAGLSNETESPVVNYCNGQDLTFEVTASSTAGVTYYFFIGCQSSNFSELQANAIYQEELILQPNEVYTINWDASLTSCGCNSDSFSAFLYTTNPCNTNPFQVGTESFQVSEDPDSEFSFEEIGCLNSSGTMTWNGPAGLPFNGTCGGQTIWSVTEPDGTVVSNAGISSSLTYPFDQLGNYEVCLNVNTGIACSGSETCHTICVQEELTPSTPGLNVDFPTLNETCLNQLFEPSITLPELFCSPATVNWSVFLAGGGSANGDYTIDDNNALTPTITFTEKGDYEVRVQVFSECGNPSFTSTVISVGGAPTVTAAQNAMGVCPDDLVCFDESFCIDDCNANFTTATITVYEGSVTNCQGNIPNPIAWQETSVTFPQEMQGTTCTASNSPCDFSWQVPDLENAEANYTVVIFVENICGSDVSCIPITVSLPGNLSLPIPSQVCSGFTIDPSLTDLSNCTWIVNGTSEWIPGDVNLITINQTSTVEVNCTFGTNNCEQSVSEIITVFPPINPSISGSSVICDNGSVLLNANSDTGVSFQWYQGTEEELESGTATALNGETSDVLSVNLPSTYSVLITDPNNCQDQSDYSITLEQEPEENFTPFTLCETETNQTLILNFDSTPPSTSDIVWSIYDESNSLVVNDVPLSYTLGELLTAFGSLTSSHTFTASYELNTVNGCQFMGEFPFTVNTLGVNTISTEELCFGSSITLPGGDNNNWNTGNLPSSAFSLASGNLIVNGNLISGTYTGITYNDGCTQQPYEITVFDNPTVNILGESVICDSPGSSLELNADASGNGDLTYQWNTNSCSAAQPLVGENGNSFTANSDGDYSVTITDENECSACAEITILLDSSPQEICPSLSFCETEVNELIGLSCLTVPSGGELTWSLTDSDNTNISSNMALSFSVQDLLNDYGTLTTNETFTAAYNFISEYNCLYESSYEITIQNLGVGNAILIDTCFATNFELTSGASGTWSTGDLPNGTYEESNGILSINSSLPTGNYTEIAFDSGCSQQPYEINITGLPQVSITGEDHLCNQPNATQTLSAVATGIGSLSYQWNENSCETAVELLNETNEQFTLENEGIYSVTVTDSNGCTECTQTEVLLDPSPVSTCSDFTICENLEETVFDFSCVTIPSGSNTPSWTIENLNNTNFPFNVPSEPFTLEDLLTVTDPLEIAVQNDEYYTFYHQWTSDDNCNYLDSFSVTVLDENIQIEQLDICSGEEINLNQTTTGDWIWDQTPASSTNFLATDNFTWLSTLEDANTTHEIRYTSSEGCGAIDYFIQVNATPEISISTPNENMCILSSQDITIDSGIATDISIDYQVGSEEIPLSTVDLVFDPTLMGISNTNPGNLHFQGSIEYTTQLAEVLLCSSEDFQAIDIVDTLTSLSVPSFICQGDEIDIDLCQDDSVDDFTFDIGGNSYFLSDCPFEIPSLFGTQNYNLNATYGSEFALQCTMQDQGEITIQQQLEYEYTTISSPCAAEQEIQINIIGGNTSSISLLPNEQLSSDILLPGESFSTVLTFNPANISFDETFNYELEITDGVCTTENILDSAQYIAPPELGISIDELISDFDGCGNDFLTMQLAVPNTNFIDSTSWSMEASYIPYTELINGPGLLLPDEIELNPPPVESSIVTITAEVFNLCGTDVDTVFHEMNPSDIQLQIEPFSDQVCPGETIEITSIINLDNYVLDAIVTPSADIDWNPVTETLVVSESVPSGEYQVEFTATGDCGVDVALAEFTVFNFYSAEFEITGLVCADDNLTFTPLNVNELSGFEWNFGDMSSASTQTPVHSYEEPGIYEVTLSAFHSAANCPVTYVQEVEIGGTQVNILPGDTEYCGASEAAYSIDFENPQSTQWIISNPYTGEELEYFTENTPVLEFFFDEEAEDIMAYEIEVYATDNFGCPSYQSVTAEILPAAQANIVYDISSNGNEISSNLSDDNLTVFLGIPCAEVQINFSNEYDANNCFWTYTFDEICDETPNNCSTISYCTDSETSEQIILTADNEYQCTATETLNVEFICAEEVTLFVPNSFTPNYDGINDNFKYEFSGVVQDFELLIFNRWGEVIFRTNELYDYWDGSDERGDYFVPDGVYNWKIIINSTGNDAFIKNGHVSICR